MAALQKKSVTKLIHGLNDTTNPLVSSSPPFLILVKIILRIKPILTSHCQPHLRQNFKLFEDFLMLQLLQ